MTSQANGVNGHASSPSTRSNSSLNQEDLSSELQQIASALAQDPDNLDENSLKQLLERLENADGVARGVEDRLDVVLGHLDGLLGNLEEKKEGNEEPKRDTTDSGTDGATAGS